MSENTEQEALESTLTASQRHELALMRARVRDLETIATLGERVKELEDELHKATTPKTQRYDYNRPIPVKINGQYVGSGHVEVNWVACDPTRVSEESIDITLRNITEHGLRPASEGGALHTYEFYIRPGD
jgi:hypothetical protein